MSKFLAIFLAVCAACSPAGVRADASGDALLDRIAATGRKAGYDRATGNYVFTGSDSIEMAPPTATKAFFMRRDKAFKVAELHAKSEILRHISQTVSAGESVAARADSGGAARAIASAYEAFAENTLPGCHVIASLEEYKDGLYTVRVAVEWNKSLREAAALPPIAPDGLAAFEEWLGRENIAGWTGTRIYRDPSGDEHLVGIGVSLASDRTNSAAMAAKSNFLLGFYGDAETRKAARTLAATSTAHDGGWDSKKLFDSLDSVSASGAPVPGLREVACRNVTHPLTSARLRIVFYAVVREAPRAVTQVDEEQAARIKVFNPLTGKYE